MYRLARRRIESLLLPALAVAATAVVVAVAYVTMSASERMVLREIRTRAQATLAVQSTTLERHLDKYRLLAPLVAQRPDVQRLVALRDRIAGERAGAIVAGMSGAVEVVFFDVSGRFIASSAWTSRSAEQPTAVVFPEAVAQAREGRLGRELIAGDGSVPASYVFASAVRLAQGDVGVVAVRVDLALVEQAWALSKDALVATDDGGRIVMTNRSLWRGRRIAVGPDAAALQWGGAAERGHALALEGRDRSGFTLVRHADGGQSREFLHLTQPLAVLGWEVSILSDTAAARSQAAKATTIAVLVCLLLAAGGWMALERRRQVLGRMRDDRAAALRLERRVRLRTRDLSAANARLAREVEEREAAEEELRRTQAELVQAAKLATLGQMSAALSHEYNQPLAAIRSNADNAQMLIDRGLAGKARGNLDRIVAMVERMAEIARTLKGFTRRAGTEQKPVGLGLVVDEAVMLVSPRLKQGGVAFTIERPDGDATVLGGHVRLEQVLLNLLANAIDAVAGRPEPAVRLSVRCDGDHALIEVADNGPGVSADLASQVFDPFFTTKEVGEGLGLGLSIAYKIVHDFSGSLTVSAAPEGGALFTVRLPLADRPRVAAE